MRTYEVGRDNSVERLGLHDHANGHGINKHLVHSNIREVFGDLGGDLIPHDHAVSLSIGLGNDSQQLAGTLLGSLKGKSDNALNTVSAENGSFGGNFPRLATVRATTLTSVFAFAVLTNNDPVEITGLGIAKRRLSTTEDASRANISVLLERLANSQSQAPERNVIRNVRCTNGTEKNCIVFLELGETVIGNVFSGLLVGFAAPVVVDKVQLESAELLTQGFENLNTGFDDLRADSISGDGGDAV